MKTSPESTFSKVASLLPGSERISSTDKELRLYIDGFVDGVRLRSASGAFVLLYAAKYRGDADACVRGMTGFEYDGAVYNFDRYGVEDSWYPEGFDGEARPEAEIAAEMRSELARAEERLAAHVARKAAGVVVNFGPTSRTLLPDEIAKYKAAIANRRSFSLTPSGFGTGYRFYSGRAINRFGQGIPASKEARELLAAPRLVYDTLDCD